MQSLEPLQRRTLAAFTALASSAKELQKITPDLSTYVSRIRKVD